VLLLKIAALVVSHQWVLTLGGLEGFLLQDGAPRMHGNLVIETEPVAGAGLLRQLIQVLSLLKYLILLLR